MYLNTYHLYHLFPFIVEWIERTPINYLFLSHATVAQWVLLTLGIRWTIKFFKDIREEVWPDRRIAGAPAMVLRSRWIKSLTAVVHRCRSNASYVRPTHFSTFWCVQMCLRFLIVNLSLNFGFHLFSMRCPRIAHSTTRSVTLWPFILLTWRPGFRCVLWHVSDGVNTVISMQIEQSFKIRGL